MIQCFLSVDNALTVNGVKVKNQINYHRPSVHEIYVGDCKRSFPLNKIETIKFGRKVLYTRPQSEVQ